MYSTRVVWEKLRSIDSATFTGSYQALGTPLINPSIRLKLVNNSSVLVTISMDGINDHDIAPASSFWLYDADTTPFRNAIPAGTQIMVKGSASTGLVYLVSQYLIEL